MARVISLTYFMHQMILIIVSSLSGVFSKMTTSDLNKKQRSSNREESNSSAEMVPDGNLFVFYFSIFLAFIGNLS